MAKITVLGEVVLDRIHENNHYQDVFGGSAGNCALALTRLGDEVYLRARFSTDSAGEFLYQSALTCGLDLSQSIRATEHATVVNIYLDDLGIPTYHFELAGTADWAWTSKELEQFDISESEALIYGSLAAVLDPGFSTLINWINEAKKAGVLIAFDPNARPSAISANQQEQIRQRILAQVVNANVVKVSHEDCEWIAPDINPEELVKNWSALGPELVVLTRGAHGACAFRHGNCVANVAGKKIKIADTVGAGDTLMAWLISGLLNLSEQIRYNAGNVEAVITRAVKASAITCSRIGCDPPTSAEVMKNLQD